MNKTLIPKSNLTSTKSKIEIPIKPYKESLHENNRKSGIYPQYLTIKTRKWHSESAGPAKALNLSLAKQTNKQKILATQRFELSTLAFLAQFSYRLSYRAVLI